MSGVTKVVISEAYGGFQFSSEAAARLRELGWEGAYEPGIARDDPRLVQVVEELGTSRASTSYSSLAVVEVPDGVKWHIHDYDGFEEIHEHHRTWDSEGVSDDCR